MSLDDIEMGFVILPTYYEAIRQLPDGERLMMYDALMAYGLDGVLPEGLPPMLNIIFTLIRPNIDSSIRRYRASVENGRKGGGQIGNQNARKKQRLNDPETTQNDLETT